MLAQARRWAEIAGRKRRAQPQLTQSQFMPAMQGGINAVSAAAAVPLQDALLLVNMLPAEQGVKVRKGYIEHCVKVPLGDGIKTLVPFSHAKVDTPLDKLFAVTSDGIYDVTTPSIAPTKKFDFPIKSGDAGWCSWHHYTTTAGQFIVMCDKANGFLLYTASTNTWAVGSVTGVPVGDLVFVTVWKNRIWFVEKDCGRAWYLAVGSISGSMSGQSFDFGNKFRYGGYLKSIWNWTLDGGEGVDDYLVAVSSAGDVLVYKGTDPAGANNFNMHGSWFIGRVMQGRRQGTDSGGELLLLSNYGLLQTSKLLGGLPATDEQVSISYKSNPRINAVMQRMATFYGWEVVFNPKDQLIFVITPKETGQPYLQFVYNVATRGWAVFANLPVKTATMWQGKMYFGTDENRVCTYDGYLDRVLLNPAEGSYEPVEWESLSSFQGFGTPAQFKRIHFMRPLFIGAAIPIYKIVARYDFNLTPPAGSPIFPPSVGGIWGVGTWDFATWGGGYVVSQAAPKGGSGLGRYAAIYMRGRSSSELTHVGTDVLYDVGGVL